ncbi:TonB-dependent receptor plug domain-containing protein [Arenibacter sp. 6A1]|uniref:TonB-dependent receptor n=1 Tax=Arenibacter sp. 6A1 TaxID=2720391 RepID=UPI0014456A33|nr:TonB-dependent receptor [Arenibacter sp. 6A1]NKI24960.1 TonB-dependent receptor plug domain-containing protein [Arenibacter sp. 6A1]
MIKNIISLMAIFLFGSLSAHTIRGVVINEDHEPLSGVGVYNKNTGGYTYSNNSGGFVLPNVSVADEVYFYSLGFKNKEIIVSQDQLNTSLRVVLTESAVSLDQVVLVSKVNALSSFVNVDVKSDPVKSSQEILRKVPGLFIGQHAGGGKAEQIFLRGFDIDHGTDVAINVDGLPVNMVSHAHGQGYADMHFIIPETIDNIDFGKGPYYADKGNLNTAGYVGFTTKKALDNNLISMEVGQNNLLRGLSMLKLLESSNDNAYIASEYMISDGVFQSPQNFNRINVMGRYNHRNGEGNEINVTASHFQSKWDASGQVPQRAVDNGSIGRFGAIDDTEGGNTSRSNILVNHERLFDGHSKIATKVFLTKYDFELYSNFTFFQEDPVNGDQIRQKEDRTMIGAESVYDKTFHIDRNNSQFQFNTGLGFRYDDINEVELSHTLNRQTILGRLAFGNIDELNVYGFMNANYKVNNWTINPGVRIDYFKFDYENLLSPVYDNKSENKVLVSPKLNTVYKMSPSLQLFAKTGIGFHSNDTRVVVANKGEKILPLAIGADIGAIYKPMNRLVLNMALWNLYLQQEFVYVGDEAIVEPSGKSKRYGVDFGARYQITDWLYAYADVNYTYARSSEEPKGEDYIPLAPDLTSSGGLTFKGVKNFSGGINYRFIKDRPANEDNSIVAQGYFVSDVNLNYTLKNWSFGLIIDNVFDTKWKEAQFASSSRLQNEATPVEEIHFTPGSPFFARAKVSVRF